MEINITKLYRDEDYCPKDYSASAMEFGDNAGKLTWQFAVEEVEDNPILKTEEEREAFRDHVRGFGAWEDEEIAAWFDHELDALFLQLISGDIRECCLEEDRDDWEGYEKEQEEGQVSGNLFRADDGDIYYYLGD